MFDMFAEDEGSGFEDDVPAPDGVEWPKREKLAFEKAIMGIYVSEHPLAPYEAMISQMTKSGMHSRKKVAFRSSRYGWQAE